MIPLRCLVAPAALFAAVVSAPAAESAGKVTDEECADFGRQLAGFFQTRKPDEVVQLLDRFALADRISTGLGFNEDEERDFRVGLLESLSKNLVRQFTTFNSGHFVRLEHRGAETCALVRVVSEEGAVNYISFVCQRRGSGPLRWGDAFLYLSGEKISETGRRLVLPLVAQTKKGLVERLTTGESEMVRNLGTLQKINQLLLQKGDAVGAWAECEKLPAALKKDRTILLLRLRAAQAIDNDKYLAIIQEWEAAFPGDATLNLISIDGDFLRKDYDGALKHVDKFAQQIGGDAYLDFLAANVLLMAERYDEAKARAQKALTAEPKLASAYDTLLAIGLKAKDHAAIVAVLDQLQATFPTAHVEKIVEGEEYEEFRASDAYREWSAKRKPAAKPEKKEQER